MLEKLLLSCILLVCEPEISGSRIEKIIGETIRFMAF
jgi:hypothetical protein